MEQQKNELIKLLSKPRNERFQLKIIKNYIWMKHFCKAIKSINMEKFTHLIKHGYVISKKSGSIIIKQHDIADYFYIILNGSMSIHIQQEAVLIKENYQNIRDLGNDNTVKDIFGPKLHTIGPGAAFGEYGLHSDLNQNKRSASVIADTNVDILASKNKIKVIKIKEFIENNEDFKEWNKIKRKQLLMSLVRKDYNKNEYIHKQGEAYTGVYYIDRQSETKNRINNKKKLQEKMISCSKKGNMSGDLELLMNFDHYASSLKCDSDKCVLYWLSKRDICRIWFKDVMRLYTSLQKLVTLKVYNRINQNIAIKFYKSCLNILNNEDKIKELFLQQIVQNGYHKKSASTLKQHKIKDRNSNDIKKVMKMDVKYNIFDDIEKIFPAYRGYLLHMNKYDKAKNVTKLYVQHVLNFGIKVDTKNALTILQNCKKLEKSKFNHINIMQTINASTLNSKQLFILKIMQYLNNQTSLIRDERLSDIFFYKQVMKTKRLQRINKIQKQNTHPKSDNNLSNKPFKRLSLMTKNKTPHSILFLRRNITESLSLYFKNRKASTIKCIREFQEQNMIKYEKVINHQHTSRLKRFDYKNRPTLENKWSNLLSPFMKNRIENEIKLDKLNEISKRKSTQINISIESNSSDESTNHRKYRRNSLQIKTQIAVNVAKELKKSACISETDKLYNNLVKIVKKCNNQNDLLKIASVNTNQIKLPFLGNGNKSASNYNKTISAKYTTKINDWINNFNDVSEYDPMYRDWKSSSLNCRYIQEKIKNFNCKDELVKRRKNIIVYPLKIFELSDNVKSNPIPGAKVNIIYSRCSMDKKMYNIVQHQHMRHYFVPKINSIKMEKLQKSAHLRIRHEMERANIYLKSKKD
ncbi:hypothetical protein A3Q56_01356 [Intoshia linei]|uniref:Cyclic nucleotide-binding domain-containing protein n=1 Tax=Intoshia linei TaxID=1819745 RepID=A0A177BBS8_9BILA|nr:hypothetical protein A3Q56_01356 [Intoshia linei]